MSLVRKYPMSCLALLVATGTALVFAIVFTAQ